MRPKLNINTHEDLLARRQQREAAFIRTRSDVQRVVLVKPTPLGRPWGRAVLDHQVQGDREGRSTGVLDQEALERTRLWSGVKCVAPPVGGSDRVADGLLSSPVEAADWDRSVRGAGRSRRARKPGVAGGVAPRVDRAGSVQGGAGGGVGGRVAGHDGLADDEIPMVGAVAADQDATAAPAVVVDDRAMVKGQEVPK